MCGHGHSLERSQSELWRSDLAYSACCMAMRCALRRDKCSLQRQHLSHPPQVSRRFGQRTRRRTESGACRGNASKGLDLGTRQAVPCSTDGKGSAGRKSPGTDRFRAEAATYPPPPKDPRFNYLVDISTKWHGRFFYFVGKYASPGPNAVSPFFEWGFARLEYQKDGRFVLSYMRHIGQWSPLYSELTIEEALKAIHQEPLLQPA